MINSLTNNNMHTNYSLYHKKTQNVGFTSRPDSVALNTSNRGGGTKNSKLGLCALALLGIGTAAYILSRGKLGSKQTKQMAEYIEFKEAKTMEEAKKFARDNFGIGLELDNNLFAANLINDVCTNVNNKMKGKAIFPKKVCFKDLSKKNCNAQYNYIKNRLELNSNGITGHYIKGVGEVNFLKLFNEGNSTYSKIKQHNNVVEEMQFTLTHELGHCNHYAKCKNALKMLSLKELERDCIKDKHFTENFLQDVRDNKLIKEFHRDYALTSPAEFIADTFACKMLGKDIPKEVEEIYIKYGGVAFPA